MLDFPAFHITPNLVMIKFASLPGNPAKCARVPDEAGIYAFFKNFSPPDPESTDAQHFSAFLIKEATRQHCLPRDGRIKPLYAVRLESKKTISTNKRQQLLTLCNSKDFRVAVASALKHSIFFEQPLYVGKSNCIRTRIKQHLSPSSPLRQRLYKVGIELPSLTLLCLPLASLGGSAEQPRDTDGDRGVEGAAANALEEIFSKLFHPLFVERYG